MQDNRQQFPVALTTLFQNTIVINEMVGNIPTPTRETLKHQLNIIHSEFIELMNGVDTEDRKEIRDGVADVLFTIAGLYGRLGIDLPKYLPPAQNSEPSEPFLYTQICMGALTILAECHFAAIYTAIGAVLEQALSNLLCFAEQQQIQVEKDLQAVVDSNRTKFDRDEGSAQATQWKYQALGIDVDQREQWHDGQLYYVTYSAADQIDDKGRQMPKGKWLKGVSFIDVNFED